MDVHLQHYLATSDRSEESQFTTATTVNADAHSRNVIIFDNTFAGAFITKSVMLAV